MLVLSQKAVRSGLTYEGASRLIGLGFHECRQTLMESPPRQVFIPHQAGPVVGFMPAINERYLSTKIAVVNYANSQNGIDSHQGAVLLFNRTSGVLQAVIDATELTAIRTTAVSHLAAGLLSKHTRPILPAEKIAIIGSGVQAFHHIKMFHQSFGITQFVLVSKSTERVQELRDALTEFALVIEYREYGETLNDCRVIITATHGDRIVLRRAQIAVDSLVLALGACHAKAKEVHRDIVSDCEFVVDSYTSLSGSGEGAFRTQNTGLKQIHELGEFTCEDAFLPQGRPIVFKAVGLGFEDLVCAAHLFETAGHFQGATRIAEFGGQRAY